ncbi:hypothetical protein HPLT_07725 [Helicobacter pylori Lithuania75]|nr:hypothetical protein HPLT_07725 [Helicobacter pylori Lithuania75]
MPCFEQIKQKLYNTIQKRMNILKIFLKKSEGRNRVMLVNSAEVVKLKMFRISALVVKQAKQD